MSLPKFQNGHVAPLQSAPSNPPTGGSSVKPRLFPTEVEAHARAAKRQFGKLGVDHSHIDPDKMRASAEAARSAFDDEMSAPATKADIEELKQLILSMKPAVPTVNVAFSGRYADADAFRRSQEQISRSLRSLR